MYSSFSFTSFIYSSFQEILREQERILRKQAEEQAALLGGGNRKSNGENHTSEFVFA